MTLRCTVRATALAMIALVSAGCDRGQPEPAPAASDLVLATFEGGAVTLADLDDHLARTAADLTWDAEVGSPDRLEALVERIALERIVLAGPLAEAVPQAAVEARVLDIERRVASRRALAGEPLAPPTRRDLETFLAENRERFDRPERRRVFHIFMRSTAASGERAEIRAALDDLAARVGAGESFALLAREHSESESRHRDGFLGEVERGRFPADFDRVVFSLGEGAVSRPVFTADGGHLFFVADVLPAREPTVEGLGVLLYQAWLAERQQARLEARARALLEARGEAWLAAEDLDEILAREPPPVVLFEVGDVVFRRGELGRLLRDAGVAEEAADHRLEQARQILRRTYHQEVIRQYDTAADLVAQDDLARERARVTMELAIERALRAALAADEERLVDHHTRNQGRFSTPVRVWLTRARFPDPDTARVAALEASIDDLDGGVLTLEELATRYGGTVETLAARTARRLRVEDPRAMRFAFALAPGAHAPPYATDGAVHVLRVDERRDAEAAPFASVRAAVVEDLYRQESGDLYAVWSQELLREHRFAADRERLARGARLLARLPS